MALKKRTGAETGFKDKDGKPILVHSYVADESGATYHINAYSQAVPTGDGVAVELDRLIQDGGVRVLTPQEVLQQSAQAAAPSKPGRRGRKPAEKPVVTKKVIEAPADEQQPGNRGDDPEPGEPSSEDIKAELQLVIGTIPTKMLAAELRRRGFVFSAVKPVIIEI